MKFHFTKSISKIFIPNFVCVLTNNRHNTYPPEFSFCDLGRAPGVGLRGAGGQKLERGDLQFLRSIDWAFYCAVRNSVDIVFLF